MILKVVGKNDIKSIESRWKNSIVFCKLAGKTYPCGRLNYYHGVKEKNIRSIKAMEGQAEPSAIGHHGHSSMWSEKYGVKHFIKCRTLRSMQEKMKSIVRW